MAIAVDSRGAATTDYPQGTETVSHTCTGSDLLLLVQVTQIASAAAYVTGVTYNGTSMTEYIDQSMASSKTQRFYGLHLVAPSTGANNIVVSKSGSGLAYRTSTQGGSYTGVDQTSPIDASNSTATFATGLPANISVSVTVTASDCWGVGMFTSGGGGINPDDTPITDNYDNPMLGNGANMGDSAGTISTGSVSATASISDQWKMVGMTAIAPAATTATFIPRIIMS